MPPPEAGGDAVHARARLTAKLLAKFERTFGGADRRDEPLQSGEIQLLDRLIAEAWDLLGKNTVVSPMIIELQMVLMEAGQQTRVLTFDLATRYIGPILLAIEDAYRVNGSPGASPAAKANKRSRVDVRIDDAGGQSDAERPGES